MLYNENKKETVAMRKITRLLAALLVLTLLICSCGGEEKRKVEIGINNNVMTEIRSGLEEGEKVVATQMSQSELKDRLANPRSNRRR